MCNDPGQRYHYTRKKKIRICAYIRRYAVHRDREMLLVVATSTPQLCAARKCLALVTWTIQLRRHSRCTAAVFCPCQHRLDHSHWAFWVTFPRTALLSLYKLDRELTRTATQLPSARRMPVEVPWKFRRMLSAGRNSEANFASSDTTSTLEQGGDG